MMSNKTINTPTLDTAGIANWKPYHNSSSNWNEGAFNQGLDTSSAFDLGWGVYSFITHHVVGDSLFVWKDANGAISKIWIDRLASGTYTFYISDLANTNVDTVAISKSNFTGKNFAYYSIAQDSVLDLEPMSSSWDLLFSRYMINLGIYYPVSGIQTNSGVETVQVYPVNNPATYSDFTNQTYSSDIDIIGSDWKSFSLTTFSWLIEDSTVYFVKLDSNNIWKLIMQNFGGSSTGNFIFSKEKMNTSTGLFEGSDEESQFIIYPNPSVDRNITLVTDLPSGVNAVEISIHDLNGRMVFNNQLTVNSGFESYNFNLSDLDAGMYIVQIRHAKGQANSRLILK
jgi:hypothetical protein